MEAEHKFFFIRRKHAKISFSSSALERKKCSILVMFWDRLCKNWLENKGKGHYSLSLGKGERNTSICCDCKNQILARLNYICSQWIMLESGAVCYWGACGHWPLEPKRKTDWRKLWAIVHIYLWFWEFS